jgi:hypothetical protein
MVGEYDYCFYCERLPGFYSADAVAQVVNVFNEQGAMTIG